MNDRTSPAQILATAVLFASITLFLELYGAYCRPDWSGFDFEQIRYAAGYLGVWIVLTSAVGWAASRRFHLNGLIAAAWLVHTAFWTLAMIVAADVPFSFRVLALGAHLAAAALLSRSDHAYVFRYAIAGAAIVWSTVAAAGFISDAFFLDTPSRVQYVGWLPFVWAAPLALFLSILAYRRNATPIPIAFVAIAVSVPLAALLVQRMNDEMRPVGDGPHVLLVTADTLRPDMLTVQGGTVESPNIEGIAAESAHFMNAYSVAPWTLPSFVGMFRSAYSPEMPNEGSFEDWREIALRFPVKPDIPTLADRMADAGYTTAGISTNPWLNAQGRGVLSGFQHLWLIPNGITVEPWGRYGALPNFRRLVRAVAPLAIVPRPNDSSPHARRIARWFMRKHRDQKIFLWVHFMDPHSPYDPPERFREGESPWPYFAPDIPAFYLPPMTPQHLYHLKEEGRDTAKRLYRGELRYLDQNIGVIVDAFKEAGLSDNGFIALTSDHGEELWEHGKVFHGQTLFEEQVRVILTFAGPGIESRKIEGPVSLIDFAPTLAALAGAEVPEVWTGENLFPVLSGEAELRSDPLIFNSTFINADEPQMGVLAEQTKLVRYLRSGRIEIFDLNEDPQEQNPRLGAAGAEAEALLSVLESFDQSRPTSEAEFAASGDEPDPEVREAIEALGYL